LRRTEDDPINENNESDEEEKRKKKQEIKMGKKKQTETYDDDQDSQMQSPGMYNSIYFLILLIFYLDIPALGSSCSVGGIARSQSHGNAPNIGDFEEPSNSENGEMARFSFIISWTDLFPATYLEHLSALYWMIFQLRQLSPLFFRCLLSLEICMFKVRNL